MPVKTFAKKEKAPKTRKNAAKREEYMKVYEFGDRKKPVILLLSGTMCYWKGNFGGVIDELSKDFLVAAVAYSGFDETDKENYDSVTDETEKIEKIRNRALQRKNLRSVRLFARRNVCRAPCSTSKNPHTLRTNRQFGPGPSWQAKGKFVVVYYGQRYVQLHSYGKVQNKVAAKKV